MLKKILIGLGVIPILLYGLFLILPFFLTGVLNNYNISKIVEDSCGLKLSLENLKLVTTPKLTVGLKAGHINLSLPDGSSIFDANNFQGKISLIPLIHKNFEIDKISVDNLNLNLKIKKDGHLLIEDAFEQEKPADDNGLQNFSILFGIKISNHLPNIYINKYNVSLIKSDEKKYSIYGGKFVLTDFIFNKKFKLNTDGKISLHDSDMFSYDIKLLNRVMPQNDLNEILMFPKTDSEQEDYDLNVITDILDAVYLNQLTADIVVDLKTSGNIEQLDLDGIVDISKFSVAVNRKKLPEGNVNLKFKGNRIDLDSLLYTADNETTNIKGNVISGKNPKIDISCISNAGFNSIVNLADSIAKSFGISTLDTLSAKGNIDANFNIKSDLKSVISSGYIKISSASLAYKLYNILIEKIFADIQLANNKIKINDSGLSILGQPLKISGSVSQNADADITVLADKLQIKGLLLALGQAGILKENNINSGTISVNAVLKGKLSSIVPKIYANINNINIKNIPSNTTVSVSDSVVDLTADGKKFNGKIAVNNAKVINPMAVISAPDAKITFGEKDILIDSAYIMLNNSRIDIIGKISDYLSKDINFDITAKGNLLASDVRTMIPKEYRSETSAKGLLPLNIKVTGNDKAQNIDFSLTTDTQNYLSLLSVEQINGKNTEIKGNIKIKGESLSFNDTAFYSSGKILAILKGGVNDLYKTQKLNLNFSLPNNISMAIPYLKNSKMNLGGNIDVLGTISNPLLKGNVDIPYIKIPDMLVSLENLSLSLNGSLVKGKGALKKLVSGGIIAENLSSDFSLNLVNNILYLSNISGDAFKGKISGNVSYNLSSGGVGVDIKGAGMDAESAIYGSAGIKNALSGKLGFTANVTTSGDTDVKLMKNLKGKASFEINDGEFGNIGRFENLILAQNILANPILKAGVNAVKSLPVLKNTAQFKSVSGNLTFSDGWTSLSPVKTSGPAMAYFITGKYNLLNGTANLIILGRISAEVVKVLGPLGDLSLSKLTSFIPGVGQSTVNLVQAITTNPYGEKISEIPSLTNTNISSKDFKVQFNGGIESSSSVKSFKWLSVCDTSELEGYTVKEQVQTVKDAINDAKQQQIDNFTKKLEEQRQQAQEASQDLKNAAEGLKNLFKSPKTDSSASQKTNQLQEDAKTESTTSEPKPADTKSVESTSVETKSTEVTKSFLTSEPENTVSQPEEVRQQTETSEKI